MLKLRFVAINATPNLAGVVRRQLSMAPASTHVGSTHCLPDCHFGRFFGGYDMRKQSTANLESVEFAHIVIGQDRRELEDLIEDRVRTGGLRIVKNKAGHRAFAIVSL